MKKVIENGNYDIVHIHIIGYYALIASQIAKSVMYQLEFFTVTIRFIFIIYIHCSSHCFIMYNAYIIAIATWRALT